MILDIVHKIQRKWIKLRLQPIPVFCMHHVCAEFVAESMNACDWMQIDNFKHKVQSMRQEGVKFISLTDAYEHICDDKLRRQKYAVLTFDDGYASLKEILPWLEEQRIPATLFINGKYLDGKSYRKNPKERYLSYDELFALKSPLIEIGSHGWEHTYATRMTDQEFDNSIEQNVELLSSHSRYISFHAYTYGDHSTSSDLTLYQHSILPVYIDELNNYNVKQIIHRKLLK